MRGTRDHRRRRAAKRVCLLVAALGGGLFARAGHAEPSPNDTVLSETLFREGKELMAQKRYDEACPKLAESYRLDPGTGTLLALALCHEGEGRLAKAWVEYTDVLAATADSHADRAALSRARLAQIEPALSKLTVVVGSASDVPGLEVLFDGTRLERPAWGTAVPLDGGGHLLEAHAPGRRPWSLRLDVAPTHDRRVVEVPPLANDIPAASVPEIHPAPVVAATSSSSSDGRRTWGLVAGGVGVVALGAGAYFGLSAISKIHDAKGQCPIAPTCTSQAPIDENSEGLRDATIADVAVGAGLAAGALGLFLLLSGHADTGTQPRVAASIDRSSLFLSLGQSF